MMQDFVRKEGALPDIEAEPKIGAVVNQWIAAKQVAKDVEETINALKPKMNMLVPDTDVRTFAATLGKTRGKVVLKRIFQDRRSPDPTKLTQLLRDKNAPPEAFKMVADESFAAAMIERGEITLDEFRATLAGNKVSYVTASFVAEA